MSGKVASIMELWPEDKFDDIQIPETEWHLNSLKIAEEFVYSTPQNELPTEEYKNKTLDYCRMQIARGGYRLAHLLVETFGKKKNEGLFLN